MESLILHLCRPNGVNGNPRRMYVKLDLDTDQFGSYAAVDRIAHEWSAGIPAEWAKLPRIRLTVDAKTYTHFRAIGEDIVLSKKHPML